MNHELSWKFAEEFVPEPPAMTLARQHSHELGIDAVSPGVAAQLRVLAAASGARTILEIGTGAGVSGPALLDGAPTATHTTIDVEPDHQQSARASLLSAGIPANQLRLIAGRPGELNIIELHKELHDAVGNGLGQNAVVHRSQLTTDLRLDLVPFDPVEVLVFIHESSVPQSN